MQQQINMDPINNEIKEEEKNDSAISADDSNVNVNLSKRSFTNFASSVKKLMDLNEYIYEDNVLDLEKFHLNHDDELITLVHTIGWWLRNHIDDDETDLITLNSFRLYSSSNSNVLLPSMIAYMECNRTNGSSCVNPLDNMIHAFRKCNPSGISFTLFEDERAKSHLTSVSSSSM